jgi:membrane fusion protein, heavy metal efflux system
MPINGAGIKRNCVLVFAGLLALCGVADYCGLALRGDASPMERRGSPVAAISRSATEKAEQVTRTGRDAIHVPAGIAAHLGIRTSTVATVETPVRLPDFPGVLALDNDRLSHVHARFGGEIVELGRSTDGTNRTLRVGEQVRQGDLLAVIWSTELGEKKSALVDALAKLRAEEQLRNRLKKLFDEGAGAGRSFRDAEKDVQARRVEIAGIERTLRTWRVTDEDIADIYAELDHLTNESAPAVNSGDWARIEVRAPISGVILEKNVVVGDIVDSSTDLFKIGDLSQLVVWAHVYEEDLSLFEFVPRPIPWTLSLPSRPAATFSGTLDRIGAVIDPAQHTALVTGRVDNSSGQLKVGQFVTATVRLPPRENELALLATAVVEDGKESVVFVQPDPNGSDFVRRPVSVVRRLRDTVYIRNTPSGVQPGDHVVTSGALMLQNAMVQLAAPANDSADVLLSIGQNPGSVGSDQ